MLIPIVFITDVNMILQTGVTITSLLLNSNPQNYDVFVLIDETVTDKNLEIILLLEKEFSISLNIIKVKEVFDEVKIVQKYWSKANLYRLLLPNLIKNYDTIIYSDVDIIFRADISSVYQDLGNYLIGASTTMIEPDYPNKIGILKEEYFCAGFVLMNLKLFREEKLVDEALKMVVNNYKYMDQDILNILCKGRVKFISNYLYGLDQSSYTSIISDNHKILSPQLLFGLKKGLIHYTGKSKPWNSFVPRGENWWYYYLNSVFFDPHYYYDIQHKTSIGDYLSIRQRFRLIVKSLLSKLY